MGKDEANKKQTLDKDDKKDKQEKHKQDIEKDKNILKAFFEFEGDDDIDLEKDQVIVDGEKMNVLDWLFDDKEN